MQITLSSALLRRKDLNGRIVLISSIMGKAKFEPKVVRRPVHEGIDNITAYLPKVSKDQMTKELNWHSSALREIDSRIQKSNWNTNVGVPAFAFKDYSDGVESDKEISTEKVLTDLLNRRKELEQRCSSACHIPDENLMEVKETRKKATEGVDDVLASVKTVTASDLLSEFFFYSKALATVDDQIHAANCSTMIDVEKSWMQGFPG